MIFQLPVGDHPYRPGQLVRSRVRPWWGIGEVLPPGGAGPDGSNFSIRWSDGVVSRGQAPLLDLEEASEPRPG